MVFCCRISFYASETGILKHTFYSASEIEIKKSWKKFTQTAYIKIPRKLYLKSGNQLLQVEKLSDLLKKGDKVIIELGYNRTFAKEFEGYISSEIKRNVPYEIECQDEMWLLKQRTVTVDIEDATVRQILEAAAPNYRVDCADELFGDFSQTDSPIKIFEALKKKSGLYTFFRGKRLVCGLPYSDVLVSETIPNFKVGANVIDWDIKFLRDEEIQLKVYGRSIQNDGSVITYDKGNEGGNVTRLNFNFQISKEELKTAVENKYKREMELASLSGNFTTFGFPYVEHGQRIRWIDNIRENIDAKFFIDEIIIKVSTTGGYKKEITPGMNFETQIIKK